MWLSKGTTPKRRVSGGLVGVAIDRDKNSQHALRWAAENLVARGQTIVLIHVTNKSSGGSEAAQDTPTRKQQLDRLTKELFLTFHCFCTRKEIHTIDVILEDTDRAKAITEYVSYAVIEHLVLGSPSKHGFLRKFKTDLPSLVFKASPDFCTMYVISKGKVSAISNASRPAPYGSPLLPQIQSKAAALSIDKSPNTKSFKDRTLVKPRKSADDAMKSPFTRRPPCTKTYSDFDSETDISFVSSGRPSIGGGSSIFCDLPESGQTSRMSTSSDHSLGSLNLPVKFGEHSPLHHFSSASQESGRTSGSYSPHSFEDAEAEMRRLKLELKQTMDMYSNACREALAARQQAMDMQRWKPEEERRLEEAKVSEESTMSMVEKERAKYKAALEAAEAAKRLAELEAQRRVEAEMKTTKDCEEMNKALCSLSPVVHYRRYSIEEIEAATEIFSEKYKIGEGGYGPVFKCHLDHTRVAVKVLRPDAGQGRAQFQIEVEVLSCMRHPNMVLLLGACPEYGVLVYEYMARGSLEDRLSCKGGTPPLSWQLRFRIAAEIATGLLFLHQAKPEPIVHRDLKPGNILLDQNYVSKISDVGLARLVPTVAENVTQCRMTSAAGTFCYIDPEYQQTGVLGVKSDVYSLGIMLLQILTGKPPMGLAYYVEQAMETGTFEEMLDPNLKDWPVKEATELAKLALRCAEMKRKDRPDLKTVILPALEKLRDMAEDSMERFFVIGSRVPSPNPSQASISTETISNPSIGNSTPKTQPSEPEI